jgi:hypothetical protein
VPKPASFPSFQTIKKINLFNPAQKTFQKICAAVQPRSGAKITLFSSFLPKSFYRLGAKSLDADQDRIAQ